MSSTTASSATRTACSIGTVMIPVPSRIRLVRAARVGQEDERSREATFGLVEVVLGDPSRIEPGLLGAPHLLEGEAVALRRFGLVEQAGEEAETVSRHVVDRLGAAAATIGSSWPNPRVAAWDDHPRCGGCRWRPARAARWWPGP